MLSPLMRTMGVVLEERFNEQVRAIYQKTFCFLIKEMGRVYDEAPDPTSHDGGRSITQVPPQASKMSTPGNSVAKNIV